MRIALLGTGDEAMELARAVHRHADHQLAAVADAAGTPSIGPAPVVSWESLLNPDVTKRLSWVGPTSLIDGPTSSDSWSKPPCP